MLELYIRLVKAGKRTINSIPDDFREAVRVAVESADGTTE